MDFIGLRRAKVMAAIKDQGADCLVTVSPADIQYLTGYCGGMARAVVAVNKDEAHLFVEASEGPLVIEQLTDGAGKLVPGVKTFATKLGQPTLAAAVEGVSKLGKAVAIESSSATVALVEAVGRGKAKPVMVPEGVARVRAAKDPGEVEAMKHLVGRSQRAMKMLLATCREKDSETDICADLDKYLRLTGAAGFAAPTRVLLGDRTALPGSAPRADYILGEWNKMGVRWGAADGYRVLLEDTFTSPYTPTPTRKNKVERLLMDYPAVRKAVDDALAAAAAVIKDGAVAKDADEAARRTLKESKIGGGGLDKYFTHDLGFGMGIEAVEYPRVGPESADVLQSGMVLSLGVGVYVPEVQKGGQTTPAWGGCSVRHMFQVTRAGCERLSGQ